MKGNHFLPPLVKENYTQMEQFNNQLGSKVSPRTLDPGHASDMYKNINLYLNDGGFIIPYSHFIMDIIEND